MVALQQVHCTRQVPADQKKENLYTELLLQSVFEKLKELQKQQFIMQQMAKIEACHD